MHKCARSEDIRQGITPCIHRDLLEREYVKLRLFLNINILHECVYVHIHTVKQISWNYQQTHEVVEYYTEHKR